MKMIVFTKNEDRIIQSSSRGLFSSLRKRSREGPAVLLVYLSGGQIFVRLIASSSYQKSLLKENIWRYIDQLISWYQGFMSAES